MIPQITDYRSPLRQRANKIEHIPDLGFAQGCFVSRHRVYAVGDPISNDAIGKNGRWRNSAQIFGTLRKCRGRHAIAPAFGPVTYGTVLLEQLPSPGYRIRRTRYWIAQKGRAQQIGIENTGGYAHSHDRCQHPSDSEKRSHDDGHTPTIGRRQSYHAYPPRAIAGLSEARFRGTFYRAIHSDGIELACRTDLSCVHEKAICIAMLLRIAGMM